LNTPWGSPSANDLPLPESADVVIVGAGFAGLAAATRLRAGGATVVVLEAGSTPGSGASGASPGMAWLGLAEHPWRILDSLGEDKARKFYAFCREGLAAMEVPSTGGEWIPADDREKADVVKSIAALRKLDVPVDGSEDGMVLPDEFAFDPRAWLDTHAAPVTVRANAIGIGDGPRVHTTRGSIRAEIVLYTAGAGIATADPWFEEKIFPYREQALWTAPFDGAPTRPVRTQQGWLSFGPAPNGGVIATGCRWATPHLEEGETQAVLVDVVQERIEAAVRARYGAVTVLGRWSWIDCKSCDGLPLIGPLPGSPRVVACTGFYGNGGGMAVRAGQGVAEGILGRKSGLPDALSPARLV
jgi:glycine/D-amino acid oxidase-like deaminating enzyme